MDFDLTVSDRSNEAENKDRIEFDGETYTDYIECSDGKSVPRISDRFEAGEVYRLINQISYVLGPKVGESEYSSAQYSTDSEAFPNRAIGQTEDSEKPSLKNAVSPGHYIYRMFGSKDKKKEAKDNFHKECEKRGIPANLEVYKRNFPVAEMENRDFVTIEENEERPWESVQIPENWNEEFGGMPPVVMEKQPEPEPEPEPEENFDGKVTVPDDEWQNCNTDAKRIRAILRNNPDFEALEKSEKVEFLLEFDQIDCGDSNIYSVLRDYDDESEPEPEPEPEGDSNTVEIDADELAELREKAEKFDQLNEMF